MFAILPVRVVSQMRPAVQHERAVWMSRPITCMELNLYFVLWSQTKLAESAYGRHGRGSDPGSQDKWVEVLSRAQFQRRCNPCRSLKICPNLPTHVHHEQAVWTPSRPTSGMALNLYFVLGNQTKRARPLHGHHGEAVEGKAFSPSTQNLFPLDHHVDSVRCYTNTFEISERFGEKKEKEMATIYGTMMR